MVQCSGRPRSKCRVGIGNSSSMKNSPTMRRGIEPAVGSPIRAAYLQPLALMAFCMERTLPFETAMSPSLSPPATDDIGTPMRNTPTASPVAAEFWDLERDASLSCSFFSSLAKPGQDCPVYAAIGMSTGTIASGCLAQAESERVLTIAMTARLILIDAL